MNIHYEIERLINYALQQRLIEPCDSTYIRNHYFHTLKISQALPNKIIKLQTQLNHEILEYPDAILNNIYKYIKTRPELMPDMNEDMIKSSIMDVVIPLPSFVRSTFKHAYINYGVNQALEYFYQLSIASNYIKMADINKNLQWINNTSYGDIEITINLSKPEKDPKEIAKAVQQIATTYPKCLLCIENEGFSGNYTKPSRFTHRTIPLCLNGETWYFQFSPYVYYKQHSIIFSSVHRDMQINLETFHALFDFVDFAPDYIIGANTDIPIVGGSILNHDHFQAGNYTFPLERSKIRYHISWNNYPLVKSYILDWPLSVICLEGGKDDLLDLSDKILHDWREYSDKTVSILNHTTKRHNALNPILRKIDAHTYKMILILRNNRQSPEYPDGIFHPHKHLHHIKKENIGLIEAMGLAILPGRLHEELKHIGQFLLANNIELINAIDKQHILWQHKDWLIELLSNKESKFTQRMVKDYIKQEVGKKFINVLECSGVFKNAPIGNTAFKKFLHHSEGEIINIV